jgi:hypothetical protein
LVFTEKRLGGTLPSLERGEQTKVYLRTVNFDGSTSQAIVLYMPKKGCLHVLGSRWGDEITYDRQSPFLVRAIPLSNPDLIITRSNTTTKIPFPPESKHTWCYYYTKAELARQQNDWKEAIHLLDEATSLGYKPADPFDLLVFVEAQAMNGNIEAAKKLSNEALNMDNGVRKGLCQVWERIQTNDPARSENKSQEQQVLTELQCPR